MLDAGPLINEILQHLRSGIDLQTRPAPAPVLDGNVLFDQVVEFVEFVTPPAVAITRNLAVDIFDFETFRVLAKPRLIANVTMCNTGFPDIRSKERSGGLTPENAWTAQNSKSMLLLLSFELARAVGVDKLANACRGNIRHFRARP